MCNAYNHPPGCHCGFGGNGNENQDLSYIKNQIYHPCFITNAFCPVCGFEVYYFQSKNGGRVFFDSLWPDWDKHPCTDNNNKIQITIKNTFYKKLNIDNVKFKPLMIQYVMNEGQLNANKLIGETVDSYGNFINLENHSLFNSSQIDKYSFFFYLRTSSDSFEIKCFKLTGEETTKKGYIETNIDKYKIINLYFDGKEDGKYYFKQLDEFPTHVFFATQGSLKKKTLESIAKKENNIQIKAKIIWIKIAEICVREIQ